MASAALIRRWHGEAAVVLAAGDYEAVFLPDLGMLGASLTHRGTELLSLHGGVSAYRNGHTNGFPLLAPWANRISQRRFRVAGVDVDLRRLPLHLDENRLPIHGTMNAQPGWQIARLEPARLTARFDYGARPDLLRAFPFPHVLEVDASLTGAGLRIETSVEPSGRRRVPVSFGWHPYFGIPGRRAAWSIRLPACRHLALDRRGIPTGAAVPERSGRLELSGRPLDDLYRLGRDRTIRLEGPDRSLELRYGSGYPYAQLYAPAGKPFVAIEPMTAPTDGLVTGACPTVRPGERFAAAFTVAAG